jgi:hypothetical protein
VAAAQERVSDDLVVRDSDVRKPAGGFGAQPVDQVRLEATTERVEVDGVDGGGVSAGLGAGDPVGLRGGGSMVSRISSVLKGWDSVRSRSASR